MTTDLITTTVFLDDQPLPSEYGIVLGVTAWDRAAAKAVELYQAGSVERLIFTGGFNAKIGASEAEVMAAYALEAGVPEGAVLIEPNATNTEENLAFSRALIEAGQRGKALRSVTLVAMSYHVRRALLAARKHLPEPVEIGWVCYPNRHYTAADWHQSDKGRGDVASELGKIERYYGLSLDELASRRP